MNEKEQKKKAKEFADFWKEKGYEKGQSQQYWTHLVSSVYGIEEPEKFLEFEDKVMMDESTGFIDVFIPSTKVLIEQKSIEKDLRKPVKQSDGSLLTPFQQAKRYIVDLPLSRHPKWVITCNFKSFLIYNMENPNSEPEEILLDDFEKEYYRLQFIVDKENENIKREMEISVKAGDVVGKLYDELLKLYIDPESERTLKSLNMLCVRLVFCLYAEDAGLFGKHAMFHDYLNRFEAVDLRRALMDLFKVLDTKQEDRDPYLEEKLVEFPYVNGGLFANEDIEIPMLNDKVKELLLKNASEDFDWSEISPTIFGAVFESTLNPDTRRSGGMHYTSIENIHKVIDPLFLDELKMEFTEIDILKDVRTRKNRLIELQHKIAKLKFLDPACGSGNFLTETYLSLRRLENRILARYQGNGQIAFGDEHFNPIEVSISQFYGIEINDFAVTVAKTALWIAESQMMKETETILNLNLDFLPLKSYVNIAEGNALRTNWNDVVSKNEIDYIMGNPPFVGQSLRSKSQSDDMALIWGKGEIETKLDYVICWYKKAIDYITDSQKNSTVAFVSTNSICQGESVPTFWKKMMDSGAEIQFAEKTFVWNSEANEKAVVHCVIVGFSLGKRDNIKRLSDNGRTIQVKYINAYLYDAPDIWITNRINNPQRNLSKMTTGSPPTDDGALTLSIEEKEEIESKYPQLKKYIKPFIGAREFLHDKVGEYSRYCFWFKDAEPSDFANIPEVKERLQKVKELRLKSNADRIQKMADYPYLFCQIRQPNTKYLVFPRHSSQNRRYIPIGYKDSDIIAGDACSIIPNVNIYEFGILTSNVHNAWMRVVCGRIKSDFRYSPSVYNNFPWCTPTNEQRERIEKTAQAILDARKLYPSSSLADLYDELSMPPELRKAHQENDKAVMEAYGFIYDKPKNGSKYFTESETVTELMKMYQKLISDVDENESK